MQSQSVRKMESRNSRYAFDSAVESPRVPYRRKIVYVLLILIVSFAFATLIFWLANGQTFQRLGVKRPQPTIMMYDNDVLICPLDEDDRINCHPDRPLSEEECTKRGCCYHAASDLDVFEWDLYNSSYLGVPSCFYPQNYVGYKVEKIIRNVNGIKVELKRNMPSGFPKDVQNVHVDVVFYDNATLRIKLTDADSIRFEPDVPLHNHVSQRREEIYIADVKENGMLTVKRKADSVVVFKTNLSWLVYSDQFLQLSTSSPSKFLYGLGEQKAEFLRSFNWTRYTIFNQGDLPVPNRNLYGCHPFYLMLEPGGNANGVFLLNSNAMDVILQPSPSVTFRTIGGILDFFIMLGPTPLDVIKQYNGIVGRPFMVPYWSLGFHLCRYGYFTLNRTRETLNRNLDAGVPIDVQWHDIDFMNRHLDFTYDPVNFEGLPEFVDDLHENGMHYVAMVSPGVSNTEKIGTYAPYDKGVELDLFVKDVNGSYIEGKVWNEKFTVYPDFSNPKTPPYWIKLFEGYHDLLHFDGIWLDMNEPLNFKNGSVHDCISSEIEDPPYVPGTPYPLRTLTLCMTAKHFSTLHYNEHNLVAFREANATFNALKDIRKKRPFIISRANFAGQGVHSGHWSGDITSDWDDMRYTIPFMLTFNLYGMPMVGSDICGFRLNTTEELCARWQALGAYYPFSRNHNDFDTVDQDPAAMGGDVLRTTKENLQNRYYMLPYLYTLFYRSHAFGENVIRPLFFEFSYDEMTYGIDGQFMWGPAVLIMPSLSMDSEIHPYYPKGLWYDFNTGEMFNSSGTHRNLSAETQYVHIAVRGGYVLPLQIPANTTMYSRENNFDLLVALDESQEAVGELYWDDGDSLDVLDSGKYNKMSFTVKNNTLHSNVVKKGYATSMNLNEVKLFGVLNELSNVTINGKPANFTVDKTNAIIKAKGYSLLQELNISWK